MEHSKAYTNSRLSVRYRRFAYHIEEGFGWINKEEISDQWKDLFDADLGEKELEAVIVFLMDDGLITDSEIIN